jgi:hypothetical protein
MFVSLYRRKAVFNRRLGERFDPRLPHCAGLAALEKEGEKGYERCGL